MAYARGIAVACKEQKEHNGSNRTRWMFAAVVIAGIVFLFILYLHKTNII
jgi:hypothetical protein